jgi:vacuolar-type H+-ATPase subunit H
MRRKERPEPLKPLATSTAERLAAIVEAAEQAAVAVIDDAEKQGRARLEEAQAEADRIVADRLDSLAELTDSLVAQAEAIRSQSDRLLSSLEEARSRFGADSAPPAGAEQREPEEPSRGSHLSAVAPVEEQVAVESTNLRPPAGSGGTSAGARLLATQMAVSGSSREEIESRLRSGFEIEDTGSILDAILGPED